MVSSQSWEILELKSLGEPCLDASCMYSWLPFFVSRCTLPYVPLSLYANVESAISSCCFFQGVGGGQSLWMPLFLVLGAPYHMLHFPYKKMLNQLTVPAVSCSSRVCGVGFLCGWVLLELGAPCHTLPLFLMCKCWISWQCPPFLSSGEAFAALTPTSSVAPVNLGTEEILCRTSPITTETQPCWACTFFFFFFLNTNASPALSAARKLLQTMGHAYTKSQEQYAAGVQRAGDLFCPGQTGCVFTVSLTEQVVSGFCNWDLIFKTFIVEFMDTRIYSCSMMMFSCVLCFYWYFSQGGETLGGGGGGAWRKQQQTLRRR